MDSIFLLIGDKRLTGWKSFSVRRSIERGPHDFKVSLRRMQWRNPASDDYRILKGGEAVSIYIGDDLLMTGEIDEVQPAYDATHLELDIVGRSKVRNLVDCSLIGKKFKQQNLLQIAKDLCTPFGINVYVGDGVDIGGKFVNDQTLDEGQIIWNFLEYLSRIKGIRLLSDAHGDLWLTRGPQGRTITPLVLGRNILTAGGNESYRSRFSDYTVLSDLDDTVMSFNDASHIQGSHKDSTIKVYRPITITSEVKCSAAECTTQANWLSKAHLGRSKQLRYVVRGYRQSNGELWPINYLVKIDDAYMGINQDRLIVETNMIIDDNGMRTEIAVMPKEAFDLQPLPEVNEDGGLF
jgi:prophage tail gpP-like protein